jgi:rRNA maturation RNase YbeY
VQEVRKAAGLAAPGAKPLAVDVINVARAPVPPELVRSVLARAATLAEVAARMPDGESSIAVRLTGDRELQRLNRAYAGIDSVTDVLSFEGSDAHLGDLAISWPMVRRQAAEFEHPAQTELALLCVHGLLHLLGWDHASPAERKEMSRIARAALRLSGVRLKPGRL